MWEQMASVMCLELTSSNYCNSKILFQMEELDRLV
jgi:hypothetical protein